MSKKYITSDKVGQFCQVMWNKGLYVSVDGNTISVKLASGEYRFIEILRESNFVDVVNSFPSETKDEADECPF